MRCFVAIDLPEDVHRALGEQQAAFCAPLARHDDDIRWTRPEGTHLTLKFLGEVSDEKATEVKKALAGLGPFEQFPVEVKGFGFFPSARHARVFWVGVEAPAVLAGLAARVEEAMEKLGFEPEHRAFTPHLTLARFKSPRPHPTLDALAQERAELSLGRFEVSEFFLFESKLSPHGAEYRKVARFPRL